MNLKQLIIDSSSPSNNESSQSIVKESVIYSLSADRPYEDSEILILGGAGRYKMSDLRRKISREASMLDREINDSDNDDAYRRAAVYVKQLANSLNTMVAALDEIKDKTAINTVKSTTNSTELETNLPTVENVIKLYESFKTTSSAPWIAVSNSLIKMGLHRDQAFNLVTGAMSAIGQL